MSDLFTSGEERAGPAEAGPWHYVRVAVERGLDQAGTGSGLTYRSREPLRIGRRVEVPLGRGGKSSAGVVIQAGGSELAEGFDLSRIKTVGRDTGAGLTEELVRLARWIAGYYICPLGMVLAAMLPAAVKRRTGLRRLVLIDRADSAPNEPPTEAPLTPAMKAAWEAVLALGRQDLPMEPHALAARTGQRTLGAINRLVKAGLLREVEAEDIRQTGGVPTQMSIEQADPGGAGVRAGGKPSLTLAQAEIVEGISGLAGAFGVHLIRGVTGSGKTEVYLRVIEEVLRGGRSALVLVPEISLTPQIAGRFVERLATAGVAVLHSGLSASQRHREWARAAGGAARVVVGARSAVFAPLDRLGIVVVDEEHASDYKQDQLPRYHGRDVAIKRAQMCGCPVVLGSATPSLESWANAVGMESGPDGNADSPPKYRLWELRERVGGGSLPRVEVVNLNEERRLRQARGGGGASRENAFLHTIGPTLEDAIGETLRQGGQAILLLNRRGYASYVACPDAGCGFALACDECDAKMVQHRVIAGGHAPKGMVRCHHCGAQSLIPAACPLCGKRLIALGLGTQRVEEELARKFGHLLGATDVAGSTADPGAMDPNAARRWTAPPGMLRVDGDTMGSARDYFDVLSRFARGDLRLLLGTQMISKGLDFPNVRLVGVINADTALGLPDFRAAERTFQLVSQVAGRAGRGSIPGRVIVQTFDPGQAPIRFAAAHDYGGFAADELECRRRAGLPPASRMARIVCRDTALEKARGAADAIAAAIRDESRRQSPPPPRVSGPMPCAIARIGGFHRFSVEVTATGRTAIQSVLQAVRARGLLKSDARTAVDIDPIALL